MNYIIKNYRYKQKTFQGKSWLGAQEAEDAQAAKARAPRQALGGWGIILNHLYLQKRFGFTPPSDVPK